jgi:hypothetical protein
MEILMINDQVLNKIILESQEPKDKKFCVEKGSIALPIINELLHANENIECLMAFTWRGYKSRKFKGLIAVSNQKLIIIQVEKTLTGKPKFEDIRLVGLDQFIIAEQTGIRKTNPLTHNFRYNYKLNGKNKTYEDLGFLTVERADYLIAAKEYYLSKNKK